MRLYFIYEMYKLGVIIMQKLHIIGLQLLIFLPQSSKMSNHPLRQSLTHLLIWLERLGRKETSRQTLLTSNHMSRQTPSYNKLSCQLSVYRTSFVVYILFCFQKYKSILNSCSFFCYPSNWEWARV